MSKKILKTLRAVGPSGIPRAALDYMRPFVTHEPLYLPLIDLVEQTRQHSIQAGA